MHTCYGIQEVCIYVAMTDCTECSEANRGECDGRNELATTTARRHNFRLFCVQSGAEMG